MTTHYAALDVELHVVAALTAELAWYDDLDVVALKQTLATDLATRATLIRAIEADAAALAALPERTPPLPTAVAGAIAAAALAVTPMGLLARGVTLAAATVLGATAQVRDPSAAERRRLEETLHGQRQRLVSIEDALSTHRATLARYDGFVRGATVASLNEARAARDHAEAELARAVRDHAAAEARLLPLATEVARAEAAEAALREAMVQAEDYQCQLGEAPTKTARARIHGACATRFGTSKPLEAIKDLGSQLAGAERTTAKWRDRLTFAAHGAAHVIDHLVIDGSNLSYAQRGRQRRFIGLEALDALVPQLAARFRVTVVFDASTQKRLNTRRNALEQHFGPAVEVHIAAAARGADHTFLRYADSSTTWVVTNDQLRDFTDLPAVQEGRILRYELLARMVEIPVLDVVAHFGG